MLDENTSWLWGIDYSLFYMNFKCGLIDKYSVKHYYKGQSYNNNLPDPYKELDYNSKRFKYISDLINFSYDKMI
jgi:hypothetical protein